MSSVQRSQRGFDVAGIQDVEKIQHVLTIWSLGHSPILPVLDFALAAGSIVNGTVPRSISKMDLKFLKVF